MPWATWRHVLMRTWSQSGENNISLAAAGVAFYGFTAMVPLLGAIVLTYGILAAPETVVSDMGKLTAVMPVSAAKLVGEQLMAVVKASSDKKGFGLLLALAIAFYGARSGAAAAITGLNIAYGEKETRSFLRQTGLTLAVTLCSVAIAIVALVAIAALGHLEDLASTLPGFLTALTKLGSYVLLVLVGAAGAATLYRYGPDRRKARWIWITPGSILVSSIWLILSLLFGVYVADFGSYNATYGSLGAVVVFLTWLYLSSYILLLGAELNGQLERATAADTTVGPDQPAGSRGASVADDDIGRSGFAEPAELPSAPSVKTTFVASRATSRAASWVGSPKVGMLPTVLATLGLAALKQDGRAKIGIVLLSTASLCSYLGRTPKAARTHSLPSKDATQETGSKFEG